MEVDYFNYACNCGVILMDVYLMFDKVHWQTKHNEKQITLKFTQETITGKYVGWNTFFCHLLILCLKYVSYGGTV